MLGYAGTSGATYVDYLLGDLLSTTPEMKHAFTEKLVLSPRTLYLPPMRLEPPPEGSDPSLLAEFKIQDSNIQDSTAPQLLIACFNQLYKISPQIFRIWTSIIKKVERGRLWLQQMPASIEGSTVTLTITLMMPLILTQCHTRIWK